MLLVVSGHANALSTSQHFCMQQQQEKQQQSEQQQQHSPRPGRNVSNFNAQSLQSKNKNSEINFFLPPLWTWMMGFGFGVGFGRGLGLGFILQFCSLSLTLGICR